MRIQMEGPNVAIVIEPGLQYIDKADATQAAIVIAASVDRVIFTLGPAPVTEMQVQTVGGVQTSIPVKVPGNKVGFVGKPPAKVISAPLSDGSGTFYSASPHDFVAAYD